MVREYQKEVWPGDIRSKLTRKAVKMVVKQRELLLKAHRHNPSIADPLPACTNSFTKQFGLPCAHRIKDVLFRNEPLDYMMAHKHWHLGHNRAVENPYLRILDPLISIPRGRPNNGRINIP